MKGTCLTDRVSNEITLLWYSLRMLVGRNLLAVGIISAVLLGAVFSDPVSTRNTKLAILLKQLELFAPLLGIVIFSDLISGDVQAKRATLLMCSRSGIVPVVLRKLVHGLLITSATYLLNLLVLRVFYTSFNVYSAFVIVVPGALYFGMLGLLGATVTSQALAGYALGTAALILSMVIKQAMPLVPVAFQMRNELATATLFTEHNWIFAKIAFVLLACVLAMLVILMARRHAHRGRIMVVAVLLLGACYGVTHRQWIRKVPPDIYLTNAGQQLDVIQQDDQLVVRSAVVTAWGRGKHKSNEEAKLTDTLYQSDQGRWVKQKQVEYDPSNEYDLVHLDIEAEMAPAKAALEAHARADIQVRAQGLKKLYMYLAWELQVKQVQVNGSQIQFSRYGDLVEIPLTEPANQGQTIAVEMDYAGMLCLPSYHHRMERNDKNILMVNSRWYPFVKSWYHDGPLELCTYDTRITVPTGWQVGAGELIASEGASQTWHFGTDTPCDRIGLVITRFRQHQAKVRDIVVTVSGHSMSDAYMSQIANQACDAIRYYESVFGPYPHRHLTIVEYDYMRGGGVACPSIVLMNTERCRPEVTWEMLNFYIPHEVAHQWFSMSLPKWVAEASAVYANYLYLAQQANNQDNLARFHEGLTDAFQANKDYPITLVGSTGMIPYIKGGYLFMMLTSVDKQGTIDALASFLQDQFKLQLADHGQSTEQLLEALQRISQGKLKTFISDWALTIDKFDPAVTGFTQSQTPQGFKVVASLTHQEKIRFAVPVRLSFEDGTHLDHTWNSVTDKQTAEWVLDKPVRSITLDPDHVLLDWDRRNNHRGISAFVADTPKVTEPAVPVKAPMAQWTTYTTADGLLDNKVRTLGMDREGRILAGLHLISKKPGTYVQYLDTQWKQPDTQSEASSSVYAMTVQPDGTLWTGGAGRLRRIRGNQTTVFLMSHSRGGHSMRVGKAVLEPNPAANTMIPGCVIYDMTTDAKGQVWLATDKGISIIDGNANLLRHMTTEHGLPGNEVLCLAWQDSDTLWIGTDKGCATFSQDSWSVPGQGPDDLILSIAIDSKGRVYMGTYRQGVFVYNGSTMRHYNSFNSRLPHDMITALVCDKHDRLWAGTDLGLWRKDDQTERTYTPENSGLLSSNVTDLLLNDNTLWIATDAGVARYNLTAPALVALTARN